jgi:hypothetical protein
MKDTVTVRTLLGGLTVLGLSLLLLIVALQLVARYAKTSTPPTSPEGMVTLGGVLTTDTALTPGDHSLIFKAKTKSGEVVTATTTFTVVENVPSVTPSAAAEDVESSLEPFVEPVVSEQ